MPVATSPGLGNNDAGKMRDECQVRAVQTLKRSRPKRSGKQMRRAAGMT
jgi:hypothetical protein